MSFDDYRKRQIRINELENLFSLIKSIYTVTRSRNSKQELARKLIEIKAKINEIDALPGPDKTHN